MLVWGCTPSQPGHGCGTQPCSDWDEPGHSANKFPYLAFSTRFSSLSATALPEGPGTVMAAFPHLLCKALLCNQKRQNSPTNAFPDEKELQKSESLGTAKRRTASCKEGHAPLYKQEPRADWNRAAHGSLPQVHGSTFCPLSELSFTQESQRESQWSLGTRTYTQAHSPSKWQVQKVMKKGRRSVLPHWVSQFGKNSWYPCIFGTTRFNSPSPVPTALSNSSPHL